jgi:hypothetical protein
MFFGSFLLKLLGNRLPFQSGFVILFFLEKKSRAVRVRVRVVRVRRTRVGVRFIGCRVMEL